MQTMDARAPMNAAMLALLLCACSVAEAPLPPPDAGAAFDAGASIDTGAQSDAAVGVDAGLQGDAGGILDECDPVQQTGCTPDEKCVVEGAVAGTECVLDTGDGLPLGQMCTGRDCRQGLACIRATTTATAATCARVCDFVGNGAGCENLGAQWECLTQIRGSNWGVCSELPPLCDPYTQVPCDQAFACQPYLRRSGTREFRCRTAGTSQEGQACASNGPFCDRELACVADNQGNAICRRYCETSNDCVPPTTCVGSVTTPPFMYCVQ